MIKVIEMGKAALLEKKYKQRCPHCESLLEFTENDCLQHSFDDDYSITVWYMVDCPVCKEVLRAELSDD
jgi:uncharacterized protein with PIN domain